MEEKKPINLNEFNKLEDICDSILKRHQESIDKICEDFKRELLSYYPDAIEKLNLAVYIQDIIASYFGDALTKDFFIIHQENFNEGEYSH